MADRVSNVVLNFRTNGQVQYAQTLREINAIMNNAAKEYRNHITAMGRDADETEKLRAEKQKLEIQMEAARRRTQMLREQYEAMSRDTRTTAGQLEQMRGKLLDAERAEMVLQRSLDRVNEGLSEQAIESREAEKELQRLADEAKTLEAEQRRLTSAFQLQEAQLGENASEAERLELAQRQMTQQMELAERTVANLERQLEQAKTAYGENSREVIQLETRLNEARASMARFEREMQNAGDSAEDAERDLKSFGNELTNLLSGLAAAGGIAGVVEKSLDLSSLNTQIDITFDVPEESKQVVKDAVLEVTAVIEDQEAALEGVRRQWALNADVGDEANTRIVKGAAAIAKAYSGIDFTELIQETNEVAGELEISNEAALGLINHLLRIGFPPEQLDTIAEYGQQLQRAGYEAEEIQAIMAAGVETDSWNIDNLLDGLKEGRILIAEFGAGVDDSMKEILKGTGISAKQLQQWGQAVAKGGEEGRNAMIEVTQALAEVEDKTKQNELGVKLFGTMWEDQGENILESILNMEKHLITAKENQDLLNESVDAINSDPAVQLRNAMSDLLIASEPVLTTIAEIISKVAEWIQENPKLAATITGIVTGLGILMGIIMGLTPIITAISVAATAMGVSIGAIAGPVLIVIGVIGALIAIGVALYKNWDTVKAKASELKEQVVNRFTELKDRASNAIQTFKSNVVNKVNELKTEFTNKVNELKVNAVNKFNELRNRAGEIMQQAKEKILSPIRDAKEKIGGIVDEIKGFFSGMKLEIPKIKLPKLPRFSIEGKLSLNPPSVPKLKVDWFAKGGILTQPTIFGARGNRLMVGGEAGPEAVLPLNEETLGAIGRGIATTMNRTRQPLVVQLVANERVLAETIVDDITELQEFNAYRRNLFK